MKYQKMKHRPHGIVQRLINQNFEFVLFRRIRKRQVGHLRVHTDAREPAWRAETTQDYQRTDMNEGIPWRKEVKCWKNSEHPSVRIKDKVRQWPHVLGDTSPMKTRLLFSNHRLLENSEEQEKKKKNQLCQVQTLHLGHIRFPPSTILHLEKPSTPLPGSHLHTERFTMSALMRGLLPQRLWPTFHLLLR